ncbi:hypothetical protein GlitD10_0649 [Gloeomargarita lithophora Alchichica-D10]|uniref:Uncharacterized protein n=1 Tax=Gloeomargarita lithophora Alchichica-D10 TaxID=1188229 RepID=A0A1J0AAK5_9CYAN|nr:hypothetical protein [Gloeomargarita lithophora]APB32963.1 hypothetical protein GlitD10_0649 [Gloeomargarita lithophora Alchichica-D10]
MAGTQSHQENMLIEVKQLLCLGLRPFRSQFLSKSHYSFEQVLEQATPECFLDVVAQLSRIELTLPVCNVLWLCAQRLPYEGSQGFYAAWNHLLPTNHQPEAPDT